MRKTSWYYFIGLLLITSCSKEDYENITVTLNDFTISIAEKPDSGQSIGFLQASTNEGMVNYSLITQSPDGAISIDPYSGEIAVAKAALFDFDLHSVISAKAQAENQGKKAQALITINLEERRIVFNGGPIVFTKQSFADPVNEINQDRITDSVWITRGNFKGIFNIRKENGYLTGSPINTEWAVGTTDHLDSLVFSDWITVFEKDPKSKIGVNYVMHIISDDIYLDIKFLSWTDGRNDGGGGGFSYQRSTPGD